MGAFLETINADSFAPFTECMYVSSKGEYAFVVRRESEKAGDKWRGTFFRKDFRKSSDVPIGMSQFQYTALWSARIEGSAPPTAVFIANSGQWVVQTESDTDAARIAAVVVYGVRGEVRAKLKLSDIFSQEDIIRIPTTTSMTLWGAGHYFSEKEDMFVLRIRKAEDSTNGMRFRTKAIRLSDFAIVSFEPTKDK